MDRDYIENRMKDIIERNGLFISDDTEELEFDSIQFITIVIDIEEEFHIEFTEDNLRIDKTLTLGDFCDVVVSLIA